MTPLLRLGQENTFRKSHIFLMPHRPLQFRNHQYVRHMYMHFFSSNIEYDKYKKDKSRQDRKSGINTPDLPLLFIRLKREINEAVSYNIYFYSRDT